MRARINAVRKVGRGWTAMVAVIVLAPWAQAQTLRPYIGGEGSLWSAAGSWSAGLPDGDDPVSLRSDATGTGGTFDLANGFTVAGLSAAARSMDSGDASATHSVDLNGRTVNVTGNLYVGETTASQDNTGSITLGNGTISLSGGGIKVGVRMGTTTGLDATGTLAADAGLVFTSSDLALLHVGVQNHQSGIGSGTVDFTAAAAGVLSVAGGTDNLYIGGRTAGSSGSGPSGTVRLGSNWTATTFGTESSRADLRIAYRKGNGGVYGLFSQGGGTFTAYLNNWDVAYSPDGDTPTVTGTMDLGGASTVLIDAATLRLATRQANHNGTVTLPKGSATVGTATVGGGGNGILNLTNTVFTATSALTLGTTGRIRATIGAEAAGVVLTNPDTTALSINASSTIASNRGILLTFAAPPAGYAKGTTGDHDAIHWGLKWEGADRTATLNGFVSGRLHWDDTALASTLGSNAVSVFYDPATTSTYVGVYLKKLPDPGTVVLLR